MSTSDRVRPNMFSFDLPPDLKEGLEELKARDGAPVSESIRRAIRLWLEEKEAVPVASRRPAGRKASRRGKR